MTALTLSFQETQFDVVDRNNQPWLKLPQVAQVLYSKGGDQSDPPFENGIRQIQKLYQRHADEFTDAMTALVKLPSSGGIQETRIFSLRGCHLLAMFARTKVAKEFRKWVLDILDKEVSTKKTTPKGALTPEEYAELLDKRGKIIVDRDDTIDKLISTEQQDILFNLMAIRFPEGRDRPYGWSRFNRHFVISSYKHLRAERFAAACCYIPAMPDKEVKTLPAPTIKPPVWTKPDPEGVKGEVRNIETTRKLVNELKIWANTLPREIGEPLWYALNDLQGLLATGWTEADEALSSINQGMYYLHRWQGRNGKVGNVG